MGTHIYNGIHVAIPDDVEPTDENLQALIDEAEAGDSSTSLEDLRFDKRQQINAWRMREIARGIDYDGNGYDTTEQSIININGAVTMAMLAQANSQSYSIDWTLADNTTIALDADGMIGLGVAVGTHVDAMYQAARAHKDAIKSLDEAALASYDITAGWD